MTRLITHKVGKNFWRNQQNIEEKSRQFVEEVQKIIEEEGYHPHEIFNLNQSRFDKRLNSFRTFAQKGDKRIYHNVGSMHASTHSYMIFPIINMSGALHSPLYLKSQEATGHFPTRSGYAPTIPANILARAGTSAMMSKNDLEDFLRNVFWPTLKAANVKKCLLLVDQWSSNRDNNLFDSVQQEFPEIPVKRMLIPEGTTGFIQPLDVFYFRLYKLFVRHITDCLEIDCEIWKRENYIKLQAFAHYQFQASIFRPLIQYAFYKAGYTSDRPESFTTPT